ncbi:MAG: hypothetical protein QF570_04655 [Myxococcota bacterium]|jgi:hypothetical protein|nr:hypothetical protein [Myxococcota bacterium]
MANPDYLKSVESTAFDSDPDQAESVEAEDAEEGAVEEAAVADQPAREETVEPAPPTAPSKEGPQKGSRSSRYVIVALIIFAIVLGALLIRSNGLIGVLENTVASLEADLEDSRATVAAHESHLGAIRAEVSDVVNRMAALDQLVSEPVSAKPQASPEPSESGGSGRPE